MEASVWLYLAVSSAVFCASVAAFLLTRPRLAGVVIMEGRVSHSRTRPAKHAFSYPLYYVLLDLDEALRGWWPLLSRSTVSLAQFCDHHHLHDRRSRSIAAPSLSLKDRVLAVLERDAGYKAKASCRVLLLTHLRYFGYFFSPVSFYYIYEEAELVAVVSEVSNTPWDEMHVYSLHAGNKDVAVQQAAAQNFRRYLFPKRFHVSPFMEMSYTYDWTFSDFWEDKRETEPAARAFGELVVSTSMFRYPGGSDWRKDPKDRELWFNATLRLKPVEVTPLGFLYRLLLSNPLMTQVIQFLIHFQAFRLWQKKVPIYEHPEGSVTALSRVISTVMTPLYAMEAWLDNRSKPKEA
eukprot:scaffold1876_cov257-Pinguiococcus_pyrenoidosus.AAC.8